MEVLYGLILLSAAALFVLTPLLRPRAEGADAASRLEELEARKEAKYRELRDSELDHAAGKLSDEDFRSRRDTLRSEAAEILGELNPPPAK